MAKPTSRHRWIQHCINEFNAGKPVGTRHRSTNLHYPKLREDGVIGPSTRTAIRKTRYFLGLGTEHWQGNPVEVSDNFLRLIKNPFLGDMTRRKLASKRRNARVRRWQVSRRPPPATGGLTYFDGKRCASWIARGLFAVRASGLAFALLSGFRDPAYSTSLCYRICEHPSCPGLCAGAGSNHSGIFFPRGAADCTNGPTVRSRARARGCPLNNHLPRDLPHCSYNGN